MIILLAGILLVAASLQCTGETSCCISLPEWLQSGRHHQNSKPCYGGPLQNPTNIQQLVLSQRPVIKLFKGCLSPVEIQELLTLASQRLTKETNSGFSSSLYLRHQSDAEIPILTHLAKLAGNLSGLPWKLAESVSLTKYTLSQSYGLHYDSGFMMHGKRMRRTATFLVYLNDVAKGGETIFPYASGDVGTTNGSLVDSLPVKKPKLSDICHRESVLKVTPKEGQCLLFYNHLSNSDGGGLDPLALHGSCPVEQEDKWIAQI